jgi:peptide/nickel transport system substrate-binding protein
MTVRRAWAALALATSALLASAPGHAQSVLRVAPETLSRILDPHFTTSFTTRDFGYLVFDTLFAVDDHSGAAAGMVEL